MARLLSTALGTSLTLLAWLSATHDADLLCKMHHEQTIFLVYLGRTRCAATVIDPSLGQCSLIGLPLKGSLNANAISWEE